MRRRDGVVFAGGVLGTLSRAGVAEAVPVSADGWPWATFTVNLAGTFLLAALVGWAAVRARPADLRLRFLATGVLGSFTTFSAFAVEVQQLGISALSVTYGVASVAAGLALARAGLALADRRRGGEP